MILSLRMRSVGDKTAVMVEEIRSYQNQSRNQKPETNRVVAERECTYKVSQTRDTKP